MASAGYDREGAAGFHQGKADWLFSCCRSPNPASGGEVVVRYHRADGKVSTQVYELAPVELKAFMEAAAFHRIFSSLIRCCR
jgi:hypothetical protein